MVRAFVTVSPAAALRPRYVKPTLYLTRICIFSLVITHSCNPYILVTTELARVCVLCRPFEKLNQILIQVMHSVRIHLCYTNKVCNEVHLSAVH